MCHNEFQQRGSNWRKLQISYLGSLNFSQYFIYNIFIFTIFIFNSCYSLQFLL